MTLIRKRGPRAAGIALLAAAFLVALPAVALADEGGGGSAGLPREELQFILNTFAFLIWGALVMWMCAGFTMLESGAVRTKNASMICLKNIGIYSIAGLAYYFIGYNLMYVDVGSVIGSFQFLYGPSDAEIALLDGAVENLADVVGNGYAVMSDWFFQMVFVATAASIVSGAIAERIKMWAFFAFTLILTAFIYPIVGSWFWGGGWLAEEGFVDFAGSTIVHSTGGWAALAGLIIIGPRLGKYRRDGTVKATPPSNVLLVTLGVLILWLGWFGFNGGSQAGAGKRRRRGGHEQRAGQHQPGRGGRGGGRAGRVPSHLRPHGPVRGPQRGPRRAGLHHPPLPTSPITGGRSSSGPSAASSAPWPSGAWRRSRSTTWSAPSPPTSCAASGEPWRPASPAAPSSTSSLIGIVAIGAFVFITSLIVWEAPRHGHGAAGVHRGRAARPGHRGAGHRDLPRVRPHARGTRRLRTQPTTGLKEGAFRCG